MIHVGRGARRRPRHGKGREHWGVEWWPMWLGHKEPEGPQRNKPKEVVRASEHLIGS